jgi:DNA-binding response OmpR family regulator
VPSILLIEDDELFRETLATALTERGYTVLQARDGEEGLRIFRVEPADLVLTDIVMPNMEGIATVVELRRVSHQAIHGRRTAGRGAPAAAAH